MSTMHAAVHVVAIALGIAVVITAGSPLPVWAQAAVAAGTLLFAAVAVGLNAWVRRVERQREAEQQRVDGVMNRIREWERNNKDGR